ncbi:hypothetical protein ABIB40_000031 [Pedobacter sp. UYP30]|uniref:hypothetical protein n=1 Tax=Pedobacter sp. UYP30 TaxID=1756400 RepID=UPI003399C155
MLKSKKKFIIQTERVNSYGFRVLTAGVNIEQFKRNPLMLWMHRRPNGLDKNEVLPLGYWSDIEVRDSIIYGTPVFDDTDQFAMLIYNKVENGTIAMASAGLIPLEWSDDPDLQLPGQTSRTLVKSVIDECSLVDIGANPDAMAVALYNPHGNKINLSTTPQNEWPVFKKKGSYVATSKEVQAVLSTARESEKIGVYDLSFYRTALENNFEDTKEFLNSKRAGSAVTSSLVNKPFEELFKTNGLELLKKYEPAVYAEKFKSKFGKYPSNMGL